MRDTSLPNTIALQRPTLAAPYIQPRSILNMKPACPTMRPSNGAREKLSGEEGESKRVVNGYGVATAALYWRIVVIYYQRFYITAEFHARTNWWR